MQHADYINTTRARQIEQEIVFEAFYRDPAQSAQPLYSGIVGRSALGLCDQPGASLLDRREVALSQFHVGRLSKIDKLFQKIEPGARTLRD